MRMEKKMEKRFPTVARLLAEGVIAVGSQGEIFGKASDGVEVNLG